MQAKKQVVTACYSCGHQGSVKLQYLPWVTETHAGSVRNSCAFCRSRPTTNNCQSTRVRRSWGVIFSLLHFGSLLVVQVVYQKRLDYQPDPMCHLVCGNFINWKLVWKYAPLHQSINWHDMGVLQHNTTQRVGGMDLKKGAKQVI